MDFVFDETNRRIVSLNISKEKGTTKSSCDQVEVNALGIVGDAHAGTWHRQVSMLAQEDVDRFSSLEAGGKKFRPGEFAENITTRGIDFKKVAILDHFKMGEVELEVTQIGKTCHGGGCAIFEEVGTCVMPKAGIFARTIHGGILHAGNSIEYHPRPLKIHIITLSDRASKGEYEDRSGLAIQGLLSAHFSGTRWHPVFSASLIPDEKEKLLSVLQSNVRDHADVIFTTGGTGIGPRDITPEVIEQFSEKLIPGIMDFIRMKYGENLPAALLSRSIAAIKDKTLIFSLPGSVKAVTEYINEITKILEHSILMLHGLSH